MLLSSRLTLCLIAGSALIGATLRAEETKPTVFDRPLLELMDASTIRDTGLSKLTPEELVRLQAWLERHTGERVETKSREAARKQAKKEAESRGIPFFDTPTEERFATRIPGRFEGIVGRGQLIALENGQVWRVADSQTRAIILKSPAVSMRASAMGSTYLMTIRGLGFDVRVERVK